MSSSHRDRDGSATCVSCKKHKPFAEIENQCVACQKAVCNDCATYHRQAPQGYYCKKHNHLKV